MPTPEMNSKPEAPASKPTEAAKPVTPKLGKAPAAAPVITVENTYALAYQTLKQTLQQFIRLKVPAVAALRLDAENCFETLRVALEQRRFPLADLSSIAASMKGSVDFLNNSTEAELPIVKSISADYAILVKRVAYLNAQADAKPA